MENKSLVDKAVSIKGKQYVLVQDRILYFNENYKDGSIQTEATYYPDAKMWSVKASIYPAEHTLMDMDGHPLKNSIRVFTGHSQAVIGEGMVNKTAALENAETSAVGRALAMMGIGVIDSIASADEMRKATAPAPKQSPINLLKERIKTLLMELDCFPQSRDEYEQVVLEFTGIELTDNNLPAIVEALSKQVAAEKAQK